MITARPTLEMEIALGHPNKAVAGVDEVGRGPLAGPVTAAAVILPTTVPPEILEHASDSKLLSDAKREMLDPVIRRNCRWAVAEASVAEIDRLNILHASHLAMVRALDLLDLRPFHALIDGNRLPTDLPCPGTAVVKGDRLCLSIACAAILAKVARDRLMRGLDAEHPGYGWERNAGYPTREHRDAIKRLGVTMHHRRSFRPVAEQLALSI